MAHMMNTPNMSENNHLATIVRELDTRMTHLKSLLEANKAPMMVLEAFDAISRSKNTLAHSAFHQVMRTTQALHGDYDSDDPKNDDDIAKTEPEISSTLRPRKRDGGLGNATTWRLRRGKRTIPRWCRWPDEVAVATQACTLETAPKVLHVGRCEVPLLEFPKDAKITKLSTWYVEEGWYTGQYQGKTGAFPASYVKNFSRNRKWQRNKSKGKRARKKQALKKRAG